MIFLPLNISKKKPTKASSVGGIMNKPGIPSSKLLCCTYILDEPHPIPMSRPTKIIKVRHVVCVQNQISDDDDNCLPVISIRNVRKSIWPLVFLLRDLPTTKDAQTQISAHTQLSSINSTKLLSFDKAESFKRT